MVALSTDTRNNRIFLTKSRLFFLTTLTNRPYSPKISNKIHLTPSEIKTRLTNYATTDIQTINDIPPTPDISVLRIDGSEPVLENKGGDKNVLCRKKKRRSIERISRIFDGVRRGFRGFVRGLRRGHVRR